MMKDMIHHVHTRQKPHLMMMMMLMRMVRMWAPLYMMNADEDGADVSTLGFEPLKCFEPPPPLPPLKDVFFHTTPPSCVTKSIIGPNSAPNTSAKAEGTPAGTTQLS